MDSENLSEKVSVNINISTLSQIDLLVDHGFYSNRSDFINEAVRLSIQNQATSIDRIVAQEIKNINSDQWFLGIDKITGAEVEALAAQGAKIRLRGYGLLKIAPDVDEALLFEIWESITVRGKVQCSDNIRAHYGFK